MKSIFDTHIIEDIYQTTLHIHTHVAATSPDWLLETELLPRIAYLQRHSNLFNATIENETTDTLRDLSELMQDLSTAYMPDMPKRLKAIVDTYYAAFQVAEPHFKQAQLLGDHLKVITTYLSNWAAHICKEFGVNIAQLPDIPFETHHIPYAERDIFVVVNWYITEGKHLLADLHTARDTLLHDYIKLEDPVHATDLMDYAIYINDIDIPYRERNVLEFPLVLKECSNTYKEITFATISTP